MKKMAMFDRVNVLLLFIVVIIVIYPLIFVISASVSNPTLVGSGQVWLFPKEIMLDGYIQTFQYPYLRTAFLNTIFYSLGAAIISLVINLPAAYALSRSDLFGRGILTGLFAFTMFFSGGLIPTFLVVMNLGMVNTVWSIIVPGAASMWNIIICRTFFQSNIPVELREAACIDGCSDFAIFFRIILPLSAPVVAVMAMFSIVGQWNSYFSALIYLSDMRLKPLQIILREILVMNQTNAGIQSALDMESAARRMQLVQVMKYSLIVISSLPVLVVYPFFQRYFVKGVMIGAIKG
ncbi:MAG: carbohydrate ABC transporter permease [Treponema sp.]|jgi:putative aldouronate transport system permease protein|nr:carbohydrate ABC transporter permease [Treponema sp.]